MPLATITITIRVPPVLHEMMQERLGDETQNSFVVEAIRQACRTRDRKQPKESAAK